MDRTDDIWKDRFNGDELPVEDWNSPDDFVWEAVADQTVRKKRKRFFWWFWRFFGLAFIVSAVYLFSNGLADKSAPLDEHLSTLVTSDDSTTESKDLNENIVSNNKNTNDSNKNTTTKETTVTIASLNMVENETVSTVDLNGSNSSANINKKSQRVKAIKEPKSIVIQKQQENVLSSIVLKEENSLSPISLVIPEPQHLNTADEAETLPLGVLNDFNVAAIDLKTTSLTLSNNLFDLSERKAKKCKFKKGIYLSLNVGATYWKHEISQQYTSDLSAFDFNYTNDLGYLLDLDIDIPLSNRFVLQFGMDYEQINVSSGHNSAISYDPNQEAGQANNDYSLSLATPYGLSAAEFSFTRSEDVGEDPVDLVVDFHSAHTVRNFSFPVGILYSPFGQKKRLNPYLKAGMGLNYLSGISNEIASIDTHHSAIQYDKTGSSSFNAPNIKKWHYDYRLGIGATYRWGPKLSLRIHYEYVNGLNAIFQQDKYDTKINRHHFSIGLTKAFLLLHKQ